MILACDN
jgi:hypothetical protein